MASPARRVVRLLALAAAVIVVGLGGGYLAAGLAHRHSASPPAAVAPDHAANGHTANDHAANGHAGHVMPDGTTMADDATMADEQPRPTPTASDDMGGMDMGGHDGHTGSTTTTRRPRALVLGTFGAANGAVLLSAALLRRRALVRRRSTGTR